jgi:predicted PurR-regulated permease PerM
MNDDRSPANPLVGPRLWQIRAVQDLVLLAALIGTAVFLVRIQGAVIPILIAFVLAYVLEPVIGWMETKLGWRRLYVVLGLILLLLAVVSAFLVFLAPLLSKELGRLASRIPDYIGVLREEYGIDFPQAEHVARRVAQGSPKDLTDGLRSLFGEAGRLITTVTSILGTTLSIAMALILTLIVFGFLAVRFPSLPSLKQFLPQSRREQLWHRMGQVESVFAGFFRGQILVALFTFTVFSIGFSIARVPYWFVAASLGGTFSIVPYGQAVGWIAAVSLNFFEAQASDANLSLTTILLGPSIVYAIMQSLETFVITPIVQGSSTRLHPIAVLLSVVAGGSLGGIIGVFFAIPVAATLKILFVEVFVPRLRDWAERH